MRTVLSENDLLKNYKDLKKSTNTIRQSKRTSNIPHKINISSRETDEFDLITGTKYVNSLLNDSNLIDIDNQSNLASKNAQASSDEGNSALHFQNVKYHSRSKLREKDDNNQVL